MKNKEEIEREIEKLQKQKEEIIKLEQYKDFTEIKHNKKTFRIYKWENKSVDDFKYPKGFRMAEFQEFVDLIDSGEYKLEVWKYYWVKHFSKEQQKKEYSLSGLYANGDVLSVGDGSLASSGGGGRVVVVK